MESIENLLYQAHKASGAIKLLNDEQKKTVLSRLAVVLSQNKEQIISENKRDVDRMPDTDPKKDRLLLNDARIADLFTSINDISALPDPSGKILLEHTTANGLFIQKKRYP